MSKSDFEAQRSMIQPEGSLTVSSAYVQKHNHTDISSPSPSLSGSRALAPPPFPQLRSKSRN